jgi:hypothetical protein
MSDIIVAAEVIDGFVTEYLHLSQMPDEGCDVGSVLASVMPIFSVDLINMTYRVFISDRMRVSFESFSLVVLSSGSSPTVL